MAKIIKKRAGKAPVPVQPDLSLMLYKMAIDLPNLKVRANETDFSFTVKVPKYFLNGVWNVFSDITANRKSLVFIKLCWLYKFFGKQIIIKKDGIVRKF